MGPIHAYYENGLLRPVQPLALLPGEEVRLIVVRRADAIRWDPQRLAAFSAEDEDLAEVGLDQWAADLDREGRW